MPKLVGGGGGGGGGGLVRPLKLRIFDRAQVKVLLLA